MKAAVMCSLRAGTNLNNRLLLLFWLRTVATVDLYNVLVLRNKFWNHISEIKVRAWQHCMYYAMLNSIGIALIMFIINSRGPVLTFS